MTRSPFSLASVTPIGYNYTIRPVGYINKSSWLHFSGLWEKTMTTDKGRATWFPGRLRELREGAGLTQAQLAEKVGVGRDAVARWEAGVREPGWSYVLALAEALGVDCTAFTVKPEDTPPHGPGRPRKAADTPGTAPGEGEARAGPASPSTPKTQQQRKGTTGKGKRKEG
jgi:transcriptional regulator with XRE-family HTH domain